MDEKEMPAIEASSDAHERDQYEFAFHLLPTVADGEVAGVIGELKALITTHGGEVFDEEAPQRFTLAYEIRKSVEGRSSRFTSSWFGWLRFWLTREELVKMTDEISHRTDILRNLTIRLTREEVLHPFRVFDKKQESATVVLSEADSEEAVEVSEEDLNKSLEQITL